MTFDIPIGSQSVNALFESGTSEEKKNGWFLLEKEGCHGAVSVHCSEDSGVGGDHGSLGCWPKVG